MERDGSIYEDIVITFAIYLLQTIWCPHSRKSLLSWRNCKHFFHFLYLLPTAQMKNLWFKTATRFVLLANNLQVKIDWIKYVIDSAQRKILTLSQHAFTSTNNSSNCLLLEIWNSHFVLPLWINTKNSSVSSTWELPQLPTTLSNQKKQINLTTPVKTKIL